MFGRLLRVTGTVLVIAVAFVTPVLATSAPASADTVVNGCTIVSNPTPTNFTNCPGALLGPSLPGVDLSFANLAGATFVGCGDALGFVCIGADMTSVNLTDANLTGASFAVCGSGLGTACGAADLSGANLSGANFTGSVLGACLSGVCAGADLTGTLLVPSNLAVTAKNKNGAMATWPTPPSLPGATPGSCTPPSGSTFTIGNTTVTCQVLDSQGGVATGTFTVGVTVKSHGHK